MKPLFRFRKVQIWNALIKLNTNIKPTDIENNRSAFFARFLQDFCIKPLLFPFCRGKIKPNLQPFKVFPVAPRGKAPFPRNGRGLSGPHDRRPSLHAEFHQYEPNAHQRHFGVYGAVELPGSNGFFGESRVPAGDKPLGISSAPFRRKTD